MIIAGYVDDEDGRFACEADIRKYVQHGAIRQGNVARGRLNEGMVQPVKKLRRHLVRVGCT